MKKRLVCGSATRGDAWIKQLVPASGPEMVAVFFSIDPQTFIPHVWTEPVMLWALLEYEAAPEEKEASDGEDVVGQTLLGVTPSFWNGDGPMSLGLVTASLATGEGNFREPSHEGLLGYEQAARLAESLDSFREQANGIATTYKATALEVRAKAKAKD